MRLPPENPRVFHITHVDNLPDIISGGGLISDAALMACGGPKASIGMGRIKQRRLSLPVSCHTDLKVGDCVPFYFCPRSIMLFVIQCANSPDLAYRGGQGPIVHLEADLNEVVRWANSQRRRWAFSLSNAGTSYARFHNSLTDLGEIDWDAIVSNDFSNGSHTPRGLPVKEGKQAEFLLEGLFPWSLVRRIGVASQAIAAKTRAAIANAANAPQVMVCPGWYF
ncbi:MAG: DUF4433 domain-containing protein [Myxococcales bacterium]|nr:DUF4433 domain-containing protein [Myxococcales bacterium]